MPIPPHPRRLASAVLLFFAAIFAFGACGESDPPTKEVDVARYNSGLLSEAFSASAEEFELDVDLLKSIAYNQSRFDMRGGEPSLDGGYGMMNLISREDVDHVAKAAEILDVSPEDIKTDPALNIRAAAALIRLFAEEQAGELSELKGAKAEYYRDAVARLLGSEEPFAVQAFVEDVYRTYFLGGGAVVDGEVVEVPGAGAPKDFAAVIDPAAEGSQAQGLSGAPWGSARQGVVSGADSAEVDHYLAASSSNYSSGRSSSINKIVIHTTQGSYSGAISWFRNSSARVSAHYVIRSSDGEITQMVRERDTAWHARGGNGSGIGIEHEGYVDRPSYYTDAMYRASARLVCDIARRNNIPVDRQHILGHSEVPGNDHSDPGSHWDWARYMELVRGCGTGDGGGPSEVSGEEPPANSGGNNSGGNNSGGTSSQEVLLQGVVYEGTNTSARLSGVSISVGGKSATTNSNGYYSVRVGTGTKTISFSKSGFQGKSIQREITRSGDNWGSTGLVRNSGSSSGSGSSGSGSSGSSSSGSGSGSNRTDQGQAPAGQSANATLLGVVYLNPDTDDRIPGASVILSTGETATADSNGVYRFNVIQGRSYRVTAQKSGYTTNMVARVANSRETWASIGLNRSAGQGTLRGVVFEAPNMGNRLAGATVTLSNGLSTTSSGDGSYSFRVEAGTYTVTASKTGYVARALARTVSTNQTTWGSLGLTKRQNASGQDGQGAPSGVEEAPEIVSPKGGMVVGEFPEFIFEAPERAGRERVQYTIVINSMIDALSEPEAFEFEVPEGTAVVTHVLETPLFADRYAWSVWAYYPESNFESEMADIEEFVVVPEE